MPLEVDMDFMASVLNESGCAGEPAQQQPLPSSNGNGGGEFSIDEWLRTHNVPVGPPEPYNGGRKWVLEECPFDSSHKKPDAVVYESAKGPLGFKCSHNSCSAYKWQDFRLRFEPNAYQPKPQAVASVANGAAAEGSDKPADKPASEWDVIGPPKSIGELVKEYPDLRPEVIRGLLRRGETMNIVSGTKLGKSWLSYGIGLCVVTGKRLWDTFLPVPGKALLIDNEIHPETLAFRLPRVAKSYGIEPDSYQGLLRTVNLRSHNMDMPAIGRYLGNIEPGEYSLVIIDALYRTYPEGTDENSNADMTRLFNLVDQIAAKLDSAVALVHHTTKGLQSGKQVTDVGSGAGAQSRACDTHLILRPHKDDKAVVVEAALRSFPPIEPICLKFEWPIWKLAGDLDPAELKTEKPKPNLERVASKILIALQDGPKTVTKLKTIIGRNPAIIADAVEILLAKQEVTRCIIKMRNGEYDGFELNPNQPEPTRTSSA